MFSNVLSHDFVLISGSFIAWAKHVNAGYIGLYTGTINEPHPPDTPTNSALKIHYLLFVNTFTKYEKAGLDVYLVPRPHLVHTRKRGLVSQVQILGPAEVLKPCNC